MLFSALDLQQKSYPTFQHIPTPHFILTKSSTKPIPPIRMRALALRATHFMPLVQKSLILLDITAAMTRGTIVRIIS